MSKNKEVEKERKKGRGRERGTEGGREGQREGGGRREKPTKAGLGKPKNSFTNPWTHFYCV